MAQAGQEESSVKWLEGDLGAVDRCATPWLVVAQHRPMYVIYPHKANRVVGRHLRRALEGLYNTHDVDLVLSGHVHAYARTCNVFREHCVRGKRDGMVHVTLGTAGRRLSGLERKQEEWLDYAELEWGYGRVTVEDGTRLRFEFVHTHNGQVYDSIDLRNYRGCSRACPSWGPALAQRRGALLAAAAASNSTGALVVVPGGPQGRPAGQPAQRRA